MNTPPPAEPAALPPSPVTSVTPATEAPATQAPPVSAPAPRGNRFVWPAVFVIALVCAAIVLTRGTSDDKPKEDADKPNAKKQPGDSNGAFRGREKEDKKEEKKKIAAPELDGGIAWLNTGGPLSLKKDLKGKVVILDFWTLCCINCIHIMPDLAKLEKKYANELVVIGVHSPKFENEKVTASIRKAILRYQIEHPVVNDADHAIWDRYEVDAWPTLVVIDPEGNLVGFTSGEGNYELLDIVVGKLVKEHKEKKTLNETPIRFDLAKFREGGDTPLYFPGKVTADEKGKRLFIADSTHHRIVVTDLEGNKIAVIGTGMPGKADGAFDKAQFDDPQGMCVRGDTVYVADRKNHLIREIDLKAKTVTTIAGNGEQDHDVESRRLVLPQPAKELGLNSPWDVLLDGDRLFIAMAGHHQIWLYDLKEKKIAPFAGSGRETLTDGTMRKAAFAQPSGLTTDGKFIYVADSETSSLRKVPLSGEGKVETLVGRSLFVFGDVDGPGQVADDPEMLKTEARLQHALGVTHLNGKLYVTDTYNSKIKIFDLKTNELTTLLSGRPLGMFGPMVFNEPGGISTANGKLYIADTNAHRIRVLDPATKAVSTLALKGVEPPPPPPKVEPKKDPVAPPPTGVAVPKWYEKAVKKVEGKFTPADAKPGQTVTFTLTIELNDGYHTYPTVQPEKLAATSVNIIKFPGADKVVFVGETQDPKDFLTKEEPAVGVKELRYNIGTVVYTRKAVVSPKATAGDAKVKLTEFSLSVCDKDKCYPARVVPVEAALKVLDGPAVEVEKAYAAEVTKALGGK